MELTYKREETPDLTGARRCVVISAEVKLSKTGKTMIAIGLRPSGSKISVKYFIVEGPYWNRNLTQFYDSFNVEEGNLEVVTWVGAEGAANFITDENGYLKVKNFIRKDRAADLPPYEGEKPERQTVTHFEDLSEDEELPF